MADKGNEQHITSHYKEEWDENVHYTVKNRWKPAVKDYFNFHGIPYTHEHFDIKLVKKILPHAGVYNDMWKRFPIDSFDPEKHKAHKALFDVV